MNCIDGQICIQQGKLRIRDAEGGGQPAILAIPPQCSVTVDGYAVTGETTVCSRHHFEMAGVDVAPNTQLEVSESPDALTVTMTVHLTEGKHFRIADAGWSNRLHLRLVSEPVPAEAPSMQRVYDVLHELGFIGAIDENAVRELSTTRVNISRVVLRGVAPVPEVAPSYRVLPLEWHNDVLRRWRPVNTVKPGAVVAVYEPSVPGEDGTDVHGRNIPAPTTPASLPRIGDGLVLEEGQLIAAREGRFVQSYSIFDVLPALVLNEDVVAKEGFIEFDGDVTITGSIMDGSVVRATGLITVHGGIYGATVMGLGGVRSGNSVAKSHIVAGQPSANFGTWHEHLQDASKALQNFRSVISEAVGLQLKMRGEMENGRKPMQMVNALHQIKQELSERLLILKQSLLTLCESDAPDEKVDDRWAVVHQLIRGRWQGIQLADTKMDVIDELEQCLGNYLGYIESLLHRPPADVELESIVSSVILATGDIRVSGRGVIASALECGGAVKVNGFVRGGSVIAKSGVDIHELGSGLGVETSVSVADADGQIRIQLRHPNTLLELAGVRQRNNDTEQNVVKNGVASL